MYTYKQSKASLGSFEFNGMPNPWGGIGDFSGPCDVPASQECEDHHCPNTLSRQVPPFCLWSCSAECRRYLRDKRSGSVTTQEELDRAQSVQEEIRREQERIARLNQQNIETADRENRVRESIRVQEEQSAAQEAALARNKKILFIGGGVLALLAVGSVVLRSK